MSHSYYGNPLMPEPLRLTLGTQTFYLCARDDKTELTDEEVTATKTALRRAQREILEATRLTGKALSELGDKEFGTVNSPYFKGKTKVQAFFDIMLAAFRLPPPDDPTMSAVKRKAISQREYKLEDYRRCLRHIQPMLKLLLVGLTRNDLVLADLEASVYAKPIADTIGGYVDPPWYQKLAIRWASNFRKFWEEGEVRGPIHLNLTLLQNDEPTLARTLIHEATHKFGRTNDVAYYDKHSAPKLITKMAEMRAMLAQPPPNDPNMNADALKARIQRGLERVVETAGAGITGKRPEEMTAIEALNNADSHAYFITWMVTHVSFE